MKQLTVLFLVQGNKVLLAMKKRGFGVGRWNGIGGKVEPGETIKQAAIRECREEIGVAPTDFYKAADIIFDEVHQGIRKKLHVNVFVCDTWEGEPVETEEMAPQWFDKTALPYKDMWADDPYWLPQVLEGKYLSCEFNLDDQDQVVKHQILDVGGFQ